MLKNKRAIVDRRALGKAIGELAPGDRAAVLDCLRGALEAGRAELRRRFDAGADGPTTAAGLALLVDRLIAALFDHAAGRVFPSPTPPRPIGWRWSPSAATGAANSRRSRMSICSFSRPTRQRRAASRSSNICSTCCGTWA